MTVAEGIAFAGIAITQVAIVVSLREVYRLLLATEGKLDAMNREGLPPLWDGRGEPPPFVEGRAGAQRAPCLHSVPPTEGA